MNSNFNERADSRSQKKINIGQLMQKSQQKRKTKRSRDQMSKEFDYGTDEKRLFSRSLRTEMDELKEIISHCSHCKNKLSEFVTKKPVKVHERSTQTTQKPFLIDLIEERVLELCRQNSKLSKLLEEKENQAIELQKEMNQIEEKFTTILYTLGQDISYYKMKWNDHREVQRTAKIDPETPSYIKGILANRYS